VLRNITYFAVWFTVFAIPWEAVVLIPGVGTISRLIGLVAFALGVLATITRGKLRIPTLFHALAVGFLVWGCISFYWSIDPKASLLQLNRNLQIIALLWLLWEFSDTEWRRRGLYQAYIFGAYVAAISTLINYRAGVASVGGSRFSAAEGSNPNDLGFLLVLALPMAWHLAVSGKHHWLGWINRLYLPLGMLGLFLTGSRSGMIVGALALSIVPWTLPRLRFRTKVAAVLVAVICTATAIAYVPAQSWERLSTTREQITTGTLNNRTVIWKAGLSVYPEHPIIGFGVNGFSRATDHVLFGDKGAHNAYISVLIELGFVGMFLFAGVLFYTFRGAWATRSPERKLLLVLFFTLVVGLMPRAWEGKKPTWVVLALLQTSAVAGAVARARQPSLEDSARRVMVRRPYSLPRTA
jgi:O-antigen ligase